MQCSYFDARRCRSCQLMGQPYRQQLADKQARVARTLAAVAGDMRWLPPFASAESGYRNKAKWVVGGRLGAVTLGILDRNTRGVDLRECGICEPVLLQAFGVLADAINELELEPYDVARAAGELKYLIVTASPDGELMVRLVLRSRRHLGRIRDYLPALQAVLPNLAVLSVNLHPEHKAVLEGDTEIVLTERHALPMRLGAVTLNVGPQSFFQTNTAVATGLYGQVARWVAKSGPRSVLDLYCGVGGFALHSAAPSVTSVRGVEVSADAIEAARLTASAQERPERFAFAVGDAAVLTDDSADLVIVNPPRRGIGSQLARALNQGTARQVIYSSCNPSSLAADLAHLSALTVQEGRIFDMFPQTTHVEVALLLERR